MIIEINTSLFYIIHSVAGVSVLGDFLITFFAVWAMPLMLGAVLVFALLTLIPRFHPYRYCNIQLFIVSVLSALLARLGVTELIRLVYKNPRPFEVFGDLEQVIAHAPGRSFPSGHASIAFAVAAAVSFCYPKWGAVFFVLAVLVGTARVAGGIHWPLDIVGGAIVGVASAYAVRFFVARHEKKSTA